MTISLSQDEYIEQRLDNQIAWYDRKSQLCQSTFKRLRRIEILCAAVIPLLAGFSGAHRSIPIAMGLLGAIVVVVTAFQSLGQYQENWIDYRTTCESLRHERFLFLTSSPPYHRRAAFTLLVERVEALISKENTAWAQQSREAAEASAPEAGES